MANVYFLDFIVLITYFIFLWCIFDVVLTTDFMFLIWCIFDVFFNVLIFSFDCIILLFHSLCNVERICLFFHFLVLFSFKTMLSIGIILECILYDGSKEIWHSRYVCQIWYVVCRLLGMVLIMAPNMSTVSIFNWNW